MESRLGKSLLDGKFPSEDQFGNPLRGSRGLKAGKLIAQGWRGAIESWCGDWKERSLSHQFLQRNYQSTRVCDQCSAIKPFAATPPELLPFIYTDFRLDAPWTTTIRTHDRLSEGNTSHEHFALGGCTRFHHHQSEVG